MIKMVIVMKNILKVMMIGCLIFSIFMVGGCGILDKYATAPKDNTEEQKDTLPEKDDGVEDIKPMPSVTPSATSKPSTVKEKRSIFISYLELTKYLKGKDEKTAKANIDMMIKNVKELGFNEVIVQVRSFSDAIYPSTIYPSSKVLGNEGDKLLFDVLDYFLKKSHYEGLTFIAWINPYRIRSSASITDISEKSPAYKYLNTDYVYVGGGVYFNPSKSEVHNLIVDGVREIVTRYKVDGILFDDYFYPNNEIDMKDYNEYIKSNPGVSKQQYNLSITNKLIRDVYKVCHNNNVEFGVSPDGNTTNNYNKVYADVKTWCSSDGYVDFIMPQIYYGFLNGTKPFKEVSLEWESMVTNKNIGLRIALAFYKVGVEDKWAGTGKSEWQNSNDIMKREIVLSRNLKQYNGFSLFRYDYIFDSNLHNNMTLSEIENMKNILN